MSDSSGIQFELDRPFYTNGKTIPANTRLSSEDLRDIMRDEANKPLGAEEAVKMAEDLMRRQKVHDAYMKGIHEKREHMGSAGTIAMGGGAE